MNRFHHARYGAGYQRLPVLPALISFSYANGTSLMGPKSTIDYSPEKVAQGLRNLITWETREEPAVEIVTRLGGHEARVRISAHAVSLERRDQLHKTLRGILPKDYALVLTWSE